MANTYRKVYLHIIFAVKNREALLEKSWRYRVFEYISKSLTARGHKAPVNGYADHVHLFFDYSCNELISDLVREIKKSSNKFINENNLSKFKFEWQTGYSVFSCDYNNICAVIDYIKNQEEHHKNNNFQSEYLNLLKEYQIDYQDEYVFNFIA